MKKFLMAAALVGAAMSVQGATISCANTLATIMANADGCQVGDKVFSNFAYAGTGTDPLNTQVSVSPVINVGTALFGLQFTSTLNTAWVSNFTLSFDVAIDQTACVTLFPTAQSCYISGVQDQFQGGAAGAGNTATLVGTHTPGGVLSLDATDVTHETKQSLGLNTLTMSSSYAGSATGDSPIGQFGMEVFQGTVSTVPEPATLSLMGISLLGLGLMRRRQVKK
jgi:hypothetical protein